MGARPADPEREGCPDPILAGAPPGKGTTPERPDVRNGDVTGRRSATKGDEEQAGTLLEGVAKQAAPWIGPVLLLDVLQNSRVQAWVTHDLYAGADLYPRERCSPILVGRA